MLFLAGAFAAAALLVLALSNVDDGRDFPPCTVPASAWQGRTPTIVSLEFAGSAERAGSMLACWTQPQRQSLREGVDADTWLIAAYVANLGLWCWYGTRHLWRGARRRLGWGALAAVAVAGALDLLIENPALRAILGGDTSAATRATTAAVATWTLLVLGAAYAAGAVVTGLTRAWVVVGGPVVKAAFRQPSGFDRDTAPPPPPADLVVVPESETPATFARRYRLPTAVEPGGVGISLSGGGIRSAAFALGCVQVYEQVPFPGDPDGRTIMGRADYLATVSGGGYLGGARQLLAHDLHERGEAGDALYGQQQPETQLLHGHHDYLWRNWQEAARGVPRIVAGVAVNMGLLAALVFLVARPLGWATFSTLLGQPGARSAPSGYWWATALTFAILVALGLAGGLWPHAGRSERRSVARTLQLSLVGPGAIGLVLLIIGWRGPDFAQAWVPFAAAVATGGVLFVAAKVAARAGPLDRWAKPLATSLPVWVLTAFGFGLLAFWLDGAAGDLDDLRPSIGPVLRLVIGLVVTLVAVLALFSIKPLNRWLQHQTMTTQMKAIGAPAAIGVLLSVGVMVLGHWADVRFDELRLWGTVATVIGLLYVFGDQKQWSPHLFYKRRLATAFSSTRTGPVTAQELPYNIKTAMSSWGRPVPGSPELLLCCAVHTSNLAIDSRRRVWSFTFAHDYVGGPDVGWMRTIDLEAALGHQNSGDATLLAAMAISGAAVASSMGSLGNSGSNAAVAVANARLGVWLPNPRYVRRLREQAPGELVPWLRWRRFSYLLKEVLGTFDLEDRFVYVSDGGHLENYGLLELLARRSRLIVCCDASGDGYDGHDAATAAGTLRHSLRMARDRLGISVEAIPTSGAPFAVSLAEDDTAHTFADAVRPLVPGAVPAPGGCESLAGKLAQDCVITLRITHDAIAAPGEAAPTTLLVVAMAAITAGMCDDAAVRAAATAYPDFPNDSTVDQWLTTEQFDGYVALGRHVAARAHERIAQLL